MNSLFRRIGISLLIALTFILNGCSMGAEATPVKVQLAWVPTIEYSPFYVAQTQSLYAQEGLAVEFVNGGFDDAGAPIDHIGRVVAGEADFGMSSADALLVARANGAPIVAIGAFYQRSPIAFISLAENNITKPEDFVGHKVFVDDVAGSTGIAYVAMMSSLEIDRSQINEVPRDDYSNEPLTSGRVDVMSAFVNNQPVQLRLEGKEVNTILASDYGIDVYANVIFTTEEMIAEHPDVVRAFLKATIAGIQGAVNNPEKAVEATLAQNDTLNAESEANSMNEALPLFKPAGSQVGMMSDSVWNDTFEIMTDLKLVPSNMNVQDAYTLQFLNELYPSQ